MNDMGINWNDGHKVIGSRKEEKKREMRTGERERERERNWCANVPRVVVSFFLFVLRLFIYTES